MFPSPRLSLSRPSKFTAYVASQLDITDFDCRLCLPKAVLQLSWRPSVEERDENDSELAIAGDDSSLRIYKVKTS